MLKTLSTAKSSFITATHLHELTNLNIVKNLKNVKAKHLKLVFDDVNDCLIYNRELLDGQGESFYGLQIAKYLMKDKIFNEITAEISNDYNDLYQIKQSSYNSDNYLIECHICKSKKKLETHHIIFQKEFNENEINKNKLHYKKNANYNLVTLCQSCHDEVDRNKIIINGWIETSNGSNLDYILNENPIKQGKYDEEFIRFVKLIKNETNDIKMAKIKIKEKFNRKISKETILKFWQDEKP